LDRLFGRGSRVPVLCPMLRQYSPVIAPEALNCARTHRFKALVAGDGVPGFHHVFYFCAASSGVHRPDHRIGTIGRAVRRRSLGREGRRIWSSSFGQTPVWRTRLGSLASAIAFGAHDLAAARREPSFTLRADIWPAASPLSAMAPPKFCFRLQPIGPGSLNRASATRVPSPRATARSVKSAST